MPISLPKPTLHPFCYATGASVDYMPSRYASALWAWQHALYCRFLTLWSSSNLSIALLILRLLGPQPLCTPWGCNPFVVTPGLTPRHPHASEWTKPLFLVKVRSEVWSVSVIDFPCHYGEVGGRCAKVERAERLGKFRRVLTQWLSSSYSQT